MHLCVQACVFESVFFPHTYSFSVRDILNGGNGVFFLKSSIVYMDTQTPHHILLVFSLGFMYSIFGFWVTKSIIKFYLQGILNIDLNDVILLHSG